MAKHNMEDRIDCSAFSNVFRSCMIDDNRTKEECNAEIQQMFKQEEKELTSMEYSHDFYHIHGEYMEFLTVYQRCKDKFERNGNFK